MRHYVPEIALVTMCCSPQTGMDTLEPQLAYSDFLDRLRSASKRVLLLDYDGTLAPFSVDREHAFPYPEVPELLTRIRDAGTRLVLISGRIAREALLLTGVHPHPEIWGSHGLERLKPDGNYEVGALQPEYESSLLQAVEATRQFNLESRMEIKPGSLAVHWRDLEKGQAGQLCEEVLRLWDPFLHADNPLDLLRFDGGIELRVPAVNKGSAVEAILAESGPDAAVAYLGDDLTDEDAFRVLKGRGLTALVRPQFRTTEAEVWLKPPEQLVQFLEDWLRAAEGAQT